MLVVIPTAGLGSRLDLQTKNFNKSMIQLGDTPVISKIIDSYPKYAKFIVITGYKGDQIKEFLTLAYPKKKIKFVHVDRFSGPKSSLGYTLSKSIKFIKEPFFFHANDSIFIDKDFYLNTKDKDTMFLHKKNCDTMKYATVEINKYRKKIHNKLNFLRKDFYNYTGVSFIKDYKKFNKIIKNFELNKGELSYFQSLNIHKINFSFINDWHDIGSKETKEKAEIFFSNKKNILPKNDQGIFFKKDKVFKFFSNPNIIKKRVKRSKYLKPYVPKVINKKKYFYIYKFCKGIVFSNLKNKDKEFAKLLIWLEKSFWKRKKLSQSKKQDFSNRCSNFYYEKSLNRINFLFERNDLVDQREIINGIKTLKINEMFRVLNWKDINDGIPVNFHGDLHFENIIRAGKNYKLLDWREDFDGLNDYGDIYYDFAKINHGLIIEHNKVRMKKFEILKTKNKIKLIFNQSVINKRIQKKFYKFISSRGFSTKKVDILTSLIFLNIAPLHHYPYSFFLYYLGKLLLQQSINQKK